MAMTQRLSTVLRLGTRAERARLAAAPLAAQSRAGTLPQSAAALAQEALATIGEALGEAVAAGRDHALVAGWAAGSRFLPAPAGPAEGPIRDNDAAAMSRLHALMIAEEIGLRARRDPASLVGYLYVLVGVGLGLPPARPPRAPGRGAGRQWAAFVAALDAAHPASGDARPILDAALEAAESIERLAQAICPGDQVLMPGAALNPEAGRHAIADDPREIRAALRAGARTWERFPYYEWRYGRRGRRFTRSDSAWLVTLAGLPQLTVDRQIAWLGRLLAARGMPRWLLELHLETLHEELVAAVPARRDAYARLLDAAAYLRRQRTAILDEAARRDLGAAFDRAVGPVWSQRLPDTGSLLAAAVCDERTGVANGVASLVGWLTDPVRFPAPWIAAVEATLAGARERAAPGD